jgi:hypothetical protein
MLKIIILIFLGLEILSRVIALGNDDLRNKMVMMLEDTVKDFRLNGSKTKMNLVVWILFFIAVLLC